MRDIHLSEAAKSDLVDIWVETDRQWGAAQADRYLELITGRHLVFYEVDPDRIFVIRVLHQSMDVPRHLRPS